MRFISSDQIAAQLRFKNTVQNQYRRLKLNTGETIRGRQFFEIGEQGGVLIETKPLQNAQCRIENKPETTVRYRCVGIAVNRNRPVELADSAVEIPEDAYAGKALAQALLALAAGVYRYAKEAGALVVKTLAMSINGLDGLSGGIVACVPDKGHDDLLPRDRIEHETRIARGS